MNGFSFFQSEHPRPRQRHHRYRIPDDFTSSLVVSSSPRTKTTTKSDCDESSDSSAHHHDGPSSKHYLIIVIICVVSYHNSMSCDFAFDDIAAIKENKDLRSETPISQLFQNDFWGQPMVKEYSHKSYRPLSVFTFRLNYMLHQLRPFGYHLTNVVLHLLVSMLYLSFCELIMPLKASMLAAVLFSVHPIHTEAVTSVVGRAETLCALFFLVSLLAYSRATRLSRQSTNWLLLAVSVISAGLATLSKEQGITVIILCCIYEVLLNQKLHQSSLEMLMFSARYKKIAKASCPKWIKEMAIRMTVLLMFAFLMMAIRLNVMQYQLPVFTRYDNPAAYSDTPIRQLTHNYLFALNVWLLLNPMNLCCDWTMSSISLIESIWDARNIATIAFYAALSSLLWKAVKSKNELNSTVLLTSVSLMVFPFLPASNLFFPVGFVIAERVLYIPSLGFCMLVAHGVSRILDHKFVHVSERGKKYVLWSSLFILIASHSARTIMRNQDWRTEYNIFTSGIQTNPHNAKLFNNVGHALESEERYSDALDYFLKAIEIQSDDVGAYINAGRAYSKLKQLELAEQYFVKAKNLLNQQLLEQNSGHYGRVAPSHLNLFLNLATLISRNNSRLGEAENLYREVIRMRSDYVEAHINRGEVLLKMNRTVEAERSYQTALYYDKTNPDIHYNLGVVAVEMNQLNQAIMHFDKAIHIDPNHQQALLNFAIVVQDSGRDDLLTKAETRLKKLLSLGNANDGVYFNLGMVAMSLKKYQEAEKWFKNAIDIRRDFRSANFNLALLLSDSERPIEAIPYLKNVLRSHPDHIKALTLLGDILINHSKDFDGAEKCYEQILKLDSKNIQAKHNLCVVYVEQGLLEKAEQCLTEAAEIATYKDYISRHLKIVRLRILKLRQSKAKQTNLNNN